MLKRFLLLLNQNNLSDDPELFTPQSNYCTISLQTSINALQKYLLFFSTLNTQPLFELFDIYNATVYRKSFSRRCQI
jgi:hypothetical protein